MEVGYLSEETPLIYEIPTSNFLPTFHTYRPSLTDVAFYNDEDVLDWSFYVLDSSEGFLDKKVPVVNCVDLIGSFTNLKDDEKKSMIDALIKPKVQLCPNITSF